MLKEDQSFTKQDEGRKPKIPNQHPRRSTFTHSQRGELNTYPGFNFGPCSLLPVIKFYVGAGRAQNNRRQMYGIHQEWVRQWLETPKFSSDRECWEGVGELLDLSHTGAVAGAGSWEKSCLCDAPHEPDQGFPHPSLSFPLLPLSRLELCRMMSFSPL